MIIDESYKSLYQNPRDFYYSTPEDYQQNEHFTYTGFKNQNDLTNPIVVCQQQVSDCTETIKNSETWFPLQGSYQEPGTGKYRIFIPPGTFHISLLSHVPQSETTTPNRYICVARLGTPPGDIYQTTNTATPDGFTLEQLRAGDCVNLNVAGYLTIANEWACNVPTEADGGWLYFAIRAERGPLDTDIVTTHLVTVGDENTPGTYLYWYVNQAIFGTDGDPIGSNSVGTILRCYPEFLDFGLVSLKSSY